MKKNSLGLRLLPLHQLKPGEASLIGPYSAAKAVSASISKCKKRKGCESRLFTQRQVLLVDQHSGRCYDFYIVARVQ